MRQHDRAEWRGIDRFGARAAPFQPGEQFEIGRRQSMPDLFDFIRRAVAQRRHGGFCQPRGNAHPQSAGDEFQQRPAPGLVERVEPAGDAPGQIELAAAQALDDIGQRQRRAGNVRIGLSRPDQRRRFREVADIVVGQREQCRVDAFPDQGADHRRLGPGETKLAGQRGQRQSPVRVRRVSQIIDQQAQLAIAGRLEAETVEQFRERPHSPAPAVSGSSSP